MPVHRVAADRQFPSPRYTSDSETRVIQRQAVRQ